MRPHRGSGRVQVVVVGVAAAAELPLQRRAHVAGREVHQRQRQQRARRLIQPRSLQQERRLILQSSILK